MNEVRLMIAGRGQWVRAQRLNDEGKITIGRGTENDVDLADPHASSRHAEIEQRNDIFIVRDCGSRNGTLLNGQPISGDQPIRHGDKIRIGLTDMVFMTDAEIAFSGIFHRCEHDDEPQAEAADTPDELPDPCDDLKKRLEDSQEAVRLLMIRNRFCRRLIGSPTPLHLTQEALNFMARRLGAENGFIMQIDPTAGKWTVRARFGEIRDWSAGDGKETALPLSLTIVEEVIKTAEAVISQYTLHDPRFGSSESIASLGIQTCACYPLLERGKASGVVYLDRRIESRPFDPKSQVALAAMVQELNEILYGRSG